MIEVNTAAIRQSLLSMLGLTHSPYLKAWVWRPQTFMEAERLVRPHWEDVCSLECKKRTHGGDEA